MNAKEKEALDVVAQWLDEQESKRSGETITRLSDSLKIYKEFAGDIVKVVRRTEGQSLIEKLAARLKEKYEVFRNQELDWKKWDEFQELIASEKQTATEQSSETQKVLAQSSLKLRARDRQEMAASLRQRYPDRPG